ncbi:MAG: type II toxin-antitoxin system Phd/YefM family antitoxin [Clostridia bacterium]|nr:type II toxin-antitoxin system Phd/YefM family antitoxin [Clostridia bacterium]
MTNTNITNFRKNIYKLLENAVEYNETINVSTKKGNAVIMSEEDYNSLVETLYISSIPELKEDIKKGLKEDIEDCIDENEVDW